MHCKHKLFEGLAHCDQRGKHTHQQTNFQRSRVEFANAHIERFPKYKSHYLRNDNLNRHYLSPLRILAMYELYKTACTEANKTPVSEWKYHHIFNTEYNLSFGRYMGVWVCVGGVHVYVCVCVCKQLQTTLCKLFPPCWASSVQCSSLLQRHFTILRTKK